MTEDNTPLNLSTMNTVPNSAAGMTFTTSTASSNYVPTYPSSFPYNWTFSNPSYTVAELTERQMGDLEERMARVVRRELATLLSLVVQGLEDMDGDDEEEDKGNEEA